MLGAFPNIATLGQQIKPRGHLLLNQDHPLVNRSAGLLLAVIASEFDGMRIFDFAQGYPEIVPGSSTHAPYSSGRGMPAWDFRNGAKELRFPRKAGLPTIANITSPFTCVAVIFPVANSGQIWASSPVNSAGSSAQGMGVGSTGFLVLEEASAPNETSTLAVPLNTWHVVGISQTGQSARTYMVDGQTAAGSASPGSAATTNTDPYIIGRYYSASSVVTADDYKGFIEMVLVWNTAITVPQLKSFASNPYQLFEAQQTRVMFIGGTQPAAAPTDNLGWKALKRVIEPDPPVDTPPAYRWSPGLNAYIHVVSNEWFHKPPQPEPDTLPDTPPAYKWNPGLRQYVQQLTVEWHKLPPQPEPDTLPETPPAYRWSPGLNNYFHVVTNEWFHKPAQPEPDVLPDTTSAFKWGPKIPNFIPPVVTENMGWYRTRYAPEPDVLPATPSIAWTRAWASPQQGPPPPPTQVLYYVWELRK